MAHNLLTQIERVRHESLGVLDNVVDRARELELPAPPEALGLLRNKLQENTYKVLVVGEAKRGKSSFINALIGRAILPTDVDVATSQVFLVSKAAQEAYRIRFEDGATRDIAASDLPKYGSQVLADGEGAPRLDQIIRWIEVDVPARFLPDGVSILDTPGLGSLYAAHSQITQRFIPQADAVIYVLDSGGPIGQADLDTIAAILEVTGNLFFIQTFIDQFRKEQWQEIQARNEQVLRERFAEKLADARVWPISSTNLMKAAATNDADYEIVSRHRELAAALKTFLFRVAGWSRVAAAMLITTHYYGSSKQVLLGRAAGLIEQSKERRVQVQQQVAQSKQQFDGDWGERGPKRQALMTALQRATAAGKQTLRQTLEVGGEIDIAMRARINQLASLTKWQDEANRLAETLAQAVTEAAVKKWQEVDQQVRQHALEQLGPFLEAMEHLAEASYAAGCAPSPTQQHYRLQTQDDWFEKAKGANFNFMQAVAITGIGSTVAGAGLGVVAAVTGASAPALVASILASSVLAPLAILGVGIAAGVWVLMQGRKGWKRAKETQVNRAQQELYKHLGEVRDRVRRYYFDVDLASGRVQSLVDQHFDQQVRTISDYVQRLAHEKSEDARLELTRFMDQAKLDEQQRTVKLEELRGQVAQWETLGHAIQEIGTALAGLDQSLAGAGKLAVEEQSA